MNRKNLDPLNILWVLLFLTGFLVAFVRLFVLQEDALTQVLNSTFESSKLAFEISIGLTGILCFWMGLLKVGEEAGFINILTKLLGPLFRKIMPGVPKNHPALGSITMNMAANMLGLDNAATPAGLKAMKELQDLNPKKDVASNDQIMFLVINAASVTIIPTSVFAYRAQQGSLSPTDVFIPMLITAFASTLTGFLMTAWIQKIKIFDKIIMGYLGTMGLLIGSLVFYFSQLNPEEVQRQSMILSSFILISIITLFITVAVVKKVNVYSSFIEGAKEGFGVAVTIIPYLVAMLVAIGIFRSSGAMDFLMTSLRGIVEFVGLDSKFVDAMPTAILKPLSGGGARGMMFETMKQHGADSFAGHLASIFQGSNETTFYVLAVYFGSVGVRKTRHAITCGLASDLVGTIVAIWMCYLFFN